MLILKPAHLIEQIDFSDVQRKKAFLGYITTKVREKAIAQIPNQPGLLIDIATGNGLLLVDIEKRFQHSYRLFGLDIRFPLLDEALRICTRNNVLSIEWINGNAFQLPLQESRFSVVLCLNTFLNISTFEEVKTIMKELVRICKPGGRIVIDIRNRSNLMILGKYFFHSLKKTFSTSAFSVKQFQNIQTDIGATIEQIDAIGIPLKPLAFDYIITFRKT